MRKLMVAACLWLIPVQAATRLLVTVVDQRSGTPLAGLRSEDFSVSDSGQLRRVESVESATGLIDVMLLLDTSLLGAVVQPVSESLIGQLQPKEQMAIVAFHSAADLVQDFTASQDLLRRAVASVKYGNTPRVLDALYAAIDGGFQASTYRRVLVLLSAGVEGPSRMSEREIVQLARRNGVSIYPVFVLGQEKPMFERLARQTAGACFELRDRQKVMDSKTAPRIFEAMRSPYIVSVEGNLALGERVRIEVKRPERLFVSGLPLD
jgi:VWFA-related protein